MDTATIVGWSGSGDFRDLERTALRRLGADKSRAKRVGGTLVVSGGNPVEAARRLGLLPGVAWVAVGYRFDRETYLGALRKLAKNYLRKGRRFRITASSPSAPGSGDLVLEGNSELLSTIGGSRVDERRPDVKFRVSSDGSGGACGVEIGSGPGGTPTRAEWVSCLVSGGERSSSMAWMTALSGASVRLVHSRTDDGALRHVARLYSELSSRMDSRRLQLVALGGGGDAYGRIAMWLRRHRETTYAGARLLVRGELTSFAERFPNLAFPLVLIQDEAIAAVYKSLGLGRAAGGRGPRLSLKALEAPTEYSAATFGGVEADSNAVIDALKRRT